MVRHHICVRTLLSSVIFVVKLSFIKKSCHRSHIPNEATKIALNASEKGEGHRSYSSVEDMFEFLDLGSHSELFK